MVKTIKIKGVEYPLGGQLRAMLIWESIKDVPFELRKTGDFIVYYYSLLLAGDANLSMSLKAFIEEMENDASIATQFAAALTMAEKVQKIFDKSGDDDKKKG